MIRIFHTADIHLGMKFSSYPEVQRELTEARFAAVDTLVERANSEECRLFVVAGDLFDRTRAAAADVKRAAASLSRFAGDAVLVLPGNHDFVGPDSELWARFRAEAGDRTVVLDTAAPVDLSHYGVPAAAYPAPCTAAHSHTSATGWITRETRLADVKLHIGIAHGSLAGISPDPEQHYYPMSVAGLTSLHPDLWLLGHTHIVFPAEPGPSDRVFNPGTPEPDGFDCGHAGNAFIIDAEPGTLPVARRVTTGVYRFEQRTILVNPGIDLELLTGEQVASTAGNLLLKITLSGSATSDQRQLLSRLEGAVREKVRYLAVEDADLTEAVTADRVEREFPRGSFAHSILSALLAEEDEAALSAAYELIAEARLDR